MTTPLILVRHARPLVAADIAPGEWALSEEGRQAANRLGVALRGVVGDAAVPVVSSTERKAVQTAEALGVDRVVSDGRLCEVGRPWYDDEATFRAGVERFLTGNADSGWESADHAADRFGSAIDDLGGTGIVVAHGTIISLWLARTITDLDPVTFWTALALPDAFLVDVSERSVLRIAD